VRGDSGYKANRPDGSEALMPILALPAVKAGLGLSGITWVEVSDAEADDVIARFMQIEQAGQLCRSRDAARSQADSVTDSAHCVTL